MLKEFYDWFVVPPANGLARLMLLPVGLAPLAATVITWNFIAFKEDFLPRRLRKYRMIIATLASVYVLIVTSTAVLKLPHIAYEIFLKGNDDD